ncbi:MAG: ATP-binding cassette domain-containing protein [bacterium]
MLANNENIAIDVLNLKKQFGNFIAVDSISFHVRRGEIFGFLGPNGAGKSTTIKMLCGILRPTSGSGIVSGFDITGESEKIKKTIGYMSQKFSLYEDMTVVENIDFFGGIYGLRKQELNERKEYILNLAGLQDRGKSLVAELSSGWKQRLALGCAIIHKPQIIFLDEPTSGVDPISRRNFWDLIYQVASQGATILVTTHYMDEAEHCDRICLIYDGKIIALDTPNKLKSTFKGKLLEVVCDPLMDGLDILSKSNFVKDITLFGASLHMTVYDDEYAIPLIESELKVKNIKIQKIERIAPALEDVFVSLIESKELVKQ